LTEYVLDASAALSLIIPDEDSTKVESCFADLPQESSFLVPSLWWYEVANVLAVSRKRGRLEESASIHAWNVLCSLSVRTDERSGPLFGLELLELADRHGLSAYDASYLELAMRSGSALVTVDEKLGKAATAAGVKVFP
jgi:predicted nucleic acid-binding protein